MDLLHLEVSAAFLHSHNRKKRRESHGLRQIKNNFLVRHSNSDFLLKLTAIQTKATENLSATSIKHQHLSAFQPF